MPSNPEIIRTRTGPSVWDLSGPLTEKIAQIPVILLKILALQPSGSLIPAAVNSVSAWSLVLQELH
jgi:hypothetical protein